MELHQTKTKRKRGVILTPTGLQRLQEAILSWEIVENKGNRLTLEQLSRQINISTKTLSRLWSLSASVDHKTLKLCFSAFNLEVDEKDYTVLTGENEPDMSVLLSQNSLPQQENISQPSTEQVRKCLSYPDGAVPLDSPFYIERPPIEDLVYREITQHGCIIRIRAPRQMGKSSLALRLLAFADTQQYHKVNLNCNQIDEQCLTNLNSLLRCICCQIAKQLNIDSNLDNYWEAEIGSKLSCSLYLQNYILEQCHSPLVLVLNDVERFFEYPHIAHDFFALLRSWCEEARQNNNWHKLRLIVVYSTEQYISLDINRSPFNIGLPIRLHEFTPQQVEELARRYGLQWTCGRESARLMSLVGGHPALIQLALYYLSSGITTLTDIIQDAIANGGIYRYHLQQHWAKLQANLHLVRLYTEVVNSQQGVLLDTMDVYKLESLGLIAFEGEHILPRCELYRTYFAKQLSIMAS
ncbi:MAG: AAA-like domain-containing protein [Mojavia pulchra JT2-VF2]|jgi:transcriptional regulator with XRE-family HTH domain|uniref:AAA-like domain-containing protein n=1 Tax=Mojavia pulchra JT2-VF2 TaxID=287848 RepID=A0A951UIS8_9NOST|nr:AAA-like domain-containing protein [Mojavia pulchra JT2-VF2]